MRNGPVLFSPRRWPVKVRLAVVSAGLTFAILLVFAVVVGRLVETRLRGDFRDETTTTARQVALSITFDELGQPGIRLGAEDALKRMLLADTDASMRFVDGSGRTLGRAGSLADFPPPSTSEGFVHVGPLDVATEQVPTPVLGPPVYVQYARTHDELDATVDRLWLFLGCGIVGGTLLATLAGLAVAGRAMRPIRDLTATAREIAMTRDPSQRVPIPDTDDEVSELARTLDTMLQQLDAARDETQEMVVAQREFVADASHELRTPLTSILANLELLEERLSADSEEAEMVGSALRSSQRMRRLVADLLLLARADAGRVSERSPRDLREIAGAAVSEVRPVAQDHPIELHTGDAVTVDANADELHRLAVNLIDNGVRHTPPGARIDVTVEVRGDKAVLEVCDDGPGLPAGSAEHLFDRFVRGTDKPADSSPVVGTGLGLAIVRAVAISHGGEVEAGASPHGGARFTVSLPLEGAEAPAPVNKEVSANL